MSEPLSQEAYAKAHGHLCPVCGSDNLDWGSVDIDGPVAWQSVACEDCASTWSDVYRFDCYEDLDVHGKDREARFQQLTAEMHTRIQKETTP